MSKQANTTERTPANAAAPTDARGMSTTRKQAERRREKRVERMGRIAVMRSVDDGRTWRCVKREHTREAAEAWIADRTGLHLERVTMHTRAEGGAGWVEEGEPGAGDAWIRIVEGA